jgi:adenylate cyclase
MSTHPINGELVPIGGGDTIPLVRPTLVLGRRESCDVCLRFPNISGQHCEMTFKDGVWFVRDLGSTNGTKVNGDRIQGTKGLRPGDRVTIGKREYKIQYKMAPGASAMALDEEDITSQSLLEKAGLMKTPRQPTPRPAPRKIGDWGNLDE